MLYGFLSSRGPHTASLIPTPHSVYGIGLRLENYHITCIRLLAHSFTDHFYPLLIKLNVFLTIVTP